MTMATEVLDFGYERVLLSPTLSQAEWTALSAADAALNGAAFTSPGGVPTITIGGTSVIMRDLTNQCLFIRPIERGGRQNLTSVASRVRRTLRIQPAIEIPAEFALDDNPNGVLGTIVSDAGGHRLLYIAATEDQVYTAVVDIFDVERQPRTDQAGYAIYSVMFENSGRVRPQWVRS